MREIIAFYTSARRKGFSSRLVDQVAAGAKSQGAEVIAYHLNDGVKGCQGCFYCRSHAACATNDALAPVFEQFPKADGFVVGFPIYFGNISGQGKIWLDRMWPLLAADFSPRYPGKKCVTIYAQGNPNPDICKGAIEANDGFIRRFGVEMVDSILNYGNNAPGYELPTELLERAFDAGKQLVK